MSDPDPRDLDLLYLTLEQREAYADALIFATTRKQTVPADKKDVLTPSKEKDRAEHEILLAEVTPERQGVYSRAYNRRQTWLNSRDGTIKARRVPGPQTARMIEEGTNPSRPGDRPCDGRFHSSGPCSNRCYSSVKD